MGHTVYLTNLFDFTYLVRKFKKLFPQQYKFNFDFENTGKYSLDHHGYFRGCFDLNLPIACFKKKAKQLFLSGIYL